MKTFRDITAAIIIIVFLGLVVYDLYAWYFGVNGDTISEVYLSWAKDRIYLVFGTGYLMGHLTWPQKVKGQ